MTLKPNIWNKHQSVTAGSLNQTSPPSEREESELYTCSGKKNLCCPFLKQTLSITVLLNRPVPKTSDRTWIRPGLSSCSSCVSSPSLAAFPSTFYGSLLRSAAAPPLLSWKCHLCGQEQEVPAAWASECGRVARRRAAPWRPPEAAGFSLARRGRRRFLFMEKVQKFRNIFTAGHQPTVILNKDIKLALPFSSPVRVFTFTYHFNYHCEPNIHHYYYFNF